MKKLIIMLVLVVTIFIGSIIPVFAATTYTITYNANFATSGSVPASQSAAAGTKVTLRVNSNSLARTGYTFAGWNTFSSGTGTSYSTGQSITMPTANLTLYAKWSANTYSISYYANGATSGSVPSGQSVTYGNVVTLRTNTGSLARTGYTFAGWNTNAAGTGTTYSVGQSIYVPSSNLLLYAKWTPNTYTVSFIGNGNTGGTAPGKKTWTTGSTVTMPAAGTLVNTSYAFAGWNTNSAGTGTTYAAGSSYNLGTANLTLYAKWIRYTITYNGNNSTSGYSPSSQVAAPGTSIKLNTNSGNLAKTGYFFDGWNTNSSGTGTSYSSGQSITMPSSNLSLYAKWSPNTYSIIYNSNGATAGSVPKQSVKYNSAITLAKPVSSSFTKAGCDLIAWNTQADGKGTDFAIGSQMLYNRAADLTLYAKWKQVYTGKTVKVKIWVDKTYSDMYSGWSSLTNTVVTRAKYPYYQRFNLTMTFSSPTKITSQKASCPNAPNNCITTKCGKTCSTHHTNASNLLNFVSNNRDTSYGMNTMFYYGATCYNDHDPATGIAKGVGGLSRNPGSESIIQYFNELWSTRCAQHEWSHNYGAKDQARGSCITDCIMSGGWDGINQDIPNIWCKNCEAAMKGNIGKY